MKSFVIAVFGFLGLFALYSASSYIAQVNQNYNQQFCNIVLSAIWGYFIACRIKALKN
jgi:type II secretory pathway pseudopilin PulG